MLQIFGQFTKNDYLCTIKNKLITIKKIRAMKKLFETKVRISEEAMSHYYCFLCENEEEYQRIRSISFSNIKKCNHKDGVTRNECGVMLSMSIEQELSITLNGELNFKGFGFAFKDIRDGLATTVFYMKSSELKNEIKMKVNDVYHNYLNHDSSCEH